MSQIFLQAKCNPINFRRSKDKASRSFIWGILIGWLVDPSNRNLGVRYDWLRCKMMLCWSIDEPCLPVTYHLRAITRPPACVMWLNVAGWKPNRTVPVYRLPSGTYLVFKYETSQCHRSIRWSFGFF